jgi:hypothetical protein
VLFRHRDGRYPKCDSDQCDTERYRNRVEPILWQLTLIDLAVVAGIGLVLPSLGLRWRWWLLDALGAAASCGIERSTAAAVVLAAAWVVVSLAALIAALRLAGPLLFWAPSDLVRTAGCAYAVAAAGAFACSRAGLDPIGVGEPIGELTGVHFTYIAGGALQLAGAALDHAVGRRARRLGWMAVLVTIGAPPIVALGFVTGAAIPQVGGATVMTIGVWTTASLELARAFRSRDDATIRVLLAVSGLAVWVPMVLAVAWAAGQHWAIPVLSIPDMARTHGVANALGFVGAGLGALRLTRPSVADAAR